MTTSKTSKRWAALALPSLFATTAFALMACGSSSPSGDPGGSPDSGLSSSDGPEASTGRRAADAGGRRETGAPSDAGTHGDGAAPRDASGAEADAGSPSDAAPGALDPTFGVSGKVEAIGAFVPTAAAVQADGRIVVVGTEPYASSPACPAYCTQIAALRLEADGAVDKTFGSSGTALLPLGPISEPGAVAVQSDGKILVGGVGSTATTSSFVVARLTTSGAPDKTFGSSGTAMFSLAGESSERLTGIAVQADGEIVGVVAALPLVDAGGIGPYAGFVFRLTSTGGLDDGFGSMGSVSAGWGMGQVAVQSDGDLVVVGGTGLLRLQPAGTPDTTFGGTAYYVGLGPVLASDGSLYTGLPGSITSGSGYAIVTKLSSTGALDTTYGMDGSALMQWGSIALRANGTAMALDAAGRMVVTGWYDAPFYDQLGVGRFTATGAADSTFGGGGWTVTPVKGNSARAVALGFQSDGRIVVVGGIYDSTETAVGMVVARYMP